MYISARVEDGLLQQLLADVLRTAGITAVLDVPTGVQVRRRTSTTPDGKDNSFLFVLNHNDAPVTVEVNDGGTDVFTDSPVRGAVEVGANGVLILKTGAPAWH